jgi:hypothetical protein
VSNLTHTLFGRVQGYSNTSLDLDVHLGVSLDAPPGTAWMHPGQAVADFQQRGFTPIYGPPGFVHTSYSLLWSPGNYSTFKCNTTAGIPGCGIPPELFSKHREWFWPPAPAAPSPGQLCWSNASLQQFMIAQVKGFLALNPAAEIISVSQNDNGHQCETPEEKSINAAEGTAGGALFRAVNAIADAIKNDYPHAAIDTLACEYARSQWCWTVSPHVVCHKRWVMLNKSTTVCRSVEPTCPEDHEAPTERHH